MKKIRINIRIVLLTIWLLYGFSVMYGRNVLQVISIVFKFVGINL